MIPGIVAAVGGLIGKVVDKAIPDKTEANRLKAELQAQLNDLSAQELKSATSIITAEIQSDSWLAKNWRPILMLVIVAIVANNYLLFPYANLFFSTGLELELPDKLWNLMQIGVGGYVVSRGVEKSVEKWKRN